MEKTSITSPLSTSHFWQTSGWYHAATLRERIASSDKSAVHSYIGNEHNNEQAQKKLQRWKEQAPFNKNTFFAERLLLDGITEQDLLTLLGEPIEAVQARLSEPIPPGWLVEIFALLNDASPLDDIAQLLTWTGAPSEMVAFLQPFAPLLRRGIDDVSTGIEKLTHCYSHVPFDPETIISRLLPNFMQQIMPKMSKTLVLELNIARLRGLLQGETSQERFHSYIQFLSQRSHLQSFLEEYAILARQFLVTLEFWVTHSLELLEHLCADWDEICTLLTPDSDPGQLVEIIGGMGDTHRGGRSVMILKFSSGFQLVYKPKSMSIDIHFQELLLWLNEHGAQPEFRLLKLIARDTYGWTEFLAMQECRSEAEVQRFFIRQGAYLALLYALDASDFHGENVLAIGEHPVLIDLEALFHPHSVPETNSITRRPGFKIIDNSVRRISLLPERFWSTEEFEGIDLSGLGSAEGLTPHLVSRWDGIGGDEMRLVREHVTLHGGHNLPRLNSCSMQAIDYLENIVSGFKDMYHLLIQWRDELLSTYLPRFADDEIRFVARATRTYGVLLAESFHPNILRDALRRERFFDGLWTEVEQQPSLARLIAAERADLLQGDIPMFTTHIESRDLFTSRGERIPDFFATSSLDVVRQRIEQLNEKDLYRQTWMIRASFASVPLQTSPARNMLPETGHTHAIADEKRLLATASAIGDRLYASALIEGDMVDWLGLSYTIERDWNVTLSGPDLYNGLPGIILFLSYLGMLTANTRYTELARSALNTLRMELTRLKAHPDWLSVGGFNGWGSSIYLFSHLAVLWHDPLLLREAESLVQLFPALIEKDERYDLVDGAAGGIACLLSLYAVAPTAHILTTAESCGTHLLERAQVSSSGASWTTLRQDVPLAGFARGTAGIALSLLRLSAVSGQEHFRQAALAALEYERSLYVPEKGNWQDLRKQNGQKSQTQRYGMSWSLGAPGIALGRLAALPYLDDDRTRQEIAVALATTIAQGFGYIHEQIGPNHSLCHGDGGNLEALLLATQMLGGPQVEEYKIQLERISSQLLATIEKDGYNMGTPRNIETPGLMVGLAGIGYALLRLARPEQVPSVLRLAPPIV